MPGLFIIAGPNVGKTTFACDFLPEEVRCFEFVNADLIAQGLERRADAGADWESGGLLMGSRL